MKRLYLLTLLIVFFSCNLHLSAITDISIKGVTLSPEFNVSTKVYNAFVSVDTEIIGINVTKSAEEVVTGSGSISLKKGINELEIISYIDEKEIDRYVINVTRGNYEYNKKDATLANISIEGIDFNFESGVFDYTLSVPEEKESVSISYLATNPNSKVKLKGNTNLFQKENVITLTVTSEDKKNVNTYTLNIQKMITSKVSKETKTSFFDLKDLDDFDLKLIRIALIFFATITLGTLFFFMFIKKKKI